MRPIFAATGLVLLLAVPCPGHDIPNARVDRSIQLTLTPERLDVAYEVSLSELTLVRDLRDLVGPLANAMRSELMDRYGQETGPLNGKGMLVSVDGREVPLAYLKFDLSVEEHPRYVFHYQGPLPLKGKLAFRDTNFSTSEGTSRLAIRARGNVAIVGDDLPAEVEQISIRPVWQLSDREEQRTKELEVDFQGVKTPLPSAVTPPPVSPPAPRPARSSSHRLTDLLDSASRSSFWTLAVIALGLGALHALQPGHGKTLVASASLGERRGWLTAAGVAIVATITHTGSVLMIALGLWLTQSTRYAAVHQSLGQVAGFVIAAIGLWRLGRHLGGHGEHAHSDVHAVSTGLTGVLGLGVAAGLVPCWDAVALIVFAEAVGRLTLGVLLLLTFSAGMAVVLLAVGWMATRVKRVIVDPDTKSRWEPILGAISGVILSLIGILLLAST